jgi:hypothetical protein
MKRSRAKQSFGHNAENEVAEARGVRKRPRPSARARPVDRQPSFLRRCPLRLLRTLMDGDEPVATCRHCKHPDSSQLRTRGKLYRESKFRRKPKAFNGAYAASAQAPTSIRLARLPTVLIVSCLSGELLSARQRTARELFKTSSTADESTKYQPHIPVSADTHHKLRKLQSGSSPYSPTAIYTVCIHIHPTANPSHPPPTLRTLPTQTPTSTRTYTSPKGPIEPRRFLTNAPNIHSAAGHSQHRGGISGYSCSVEMMTITIGSIWK